MLILLCSFTVIKEVKGSIGNAFQGSERTVYSYYSLEPALLWGISTFCTASIIVFSVWILNKKMGYHQTHLKYFLILYQLPDRTGYGEDIQNNFNGFISTIKMQFTEKMLNLLNSLYETLSNITLEDLKLYFNKFDEEMLPSFLLGLIIISIMMGMIIFIFDTRIIEDINYPNLVFPLIQKILKCH